jgi:hypothetical protein
MFTKIVPSFTCAVLLAVSCLPAAAQTAGSARPFRGALFGANRPDDSTQRLNISVSLLEAYDDDVFGTTGGSQVNPGTRQVGGYFSMLQPSLDYQWRGRRAQFGISEASALGYYPQVGEVRSISHSAGAGVSLQLARKTTFFVNQTAAYSPSYLFGLFPSTAEPLPGDAIAAGPNYSVNDVESYAYGTSARLSHGVRRRATISAGADIRYTDFVHNTDFQRDLDSRGLDGAFSYQGTRNTSVRVRYHYLTGNLGYGAGASTDENGLDVGMLYSRPVSATRRAFLSFSLGSSAVTTSGAPADLQLPDRVYRATGDAMFGYQFANWEARGSYRRGLEFVPGLAQPVFTNGVTADIAGLLTRRLDVALSAGYSQGASALTQRAANFDTYRASLRFQFAVAKSAAIHAEYLYYFYDFLGDVQLPVGASPRLKRNGVRLGLRLLIPAFRG